MTKPSTEPNNNLLAILRENQPPPEVWAAIIAQMPLPDAAKLWQFLRLYGARLGPDNQALLQYLNEALKNRLRNPSEPSALPEAIYLNPFLRSPTSFEAIHERFLEASKGNKVVTTHPIQKELAALARALLKNPNHSVPENFFDQEGIPEFLIAFIFPEITAVGLGDIIGGITRDQHAPKENIVKLLPLLFLTQKAPQSFLDKLYDRYFSEKPGTTVNSEIPLTLDNRIKWALLCRQNVRVINGNSEEEEEANRTVWVQSSSFPLEDPNGILALATFVGNQNVLRELWGLAIPAEWPDRDSLHQYLMYIAIETNHPEIVEYLGQRTTNQIMLTQALFVALLTNNPAVLEKIPVTHILQDGTKISNFSDASLPPILVKQTQKKHPWMDGPFLTKEQIASLQEFLPATAANMQQVSSIVQIALATGTEQHLLELFRDECHKRTLLNALRYSMLVNRADWATELTWEILGEPSLPSRGTHQSSGTPSPWAIAENSKLVQQVFAGVMQVNATTLARKESSFNQAYSIPRIKGLKLQAAIVGNRLDVLAATKITASDLVGDKLLLLATLLERTEIVRHLMDKEKERVEKIHTVQWNSNTRGTLKNDYLNRNSIAIRLDLAQTLPWCLYEKLEAAAQFRSGRHIHLVELAFVLENLELAKIFLEHFKSYPLDCLMQAMKNEKAEWVETFLQYPPISSSITGIPKPLSAERLTAYGIPKKGPQFPHQLQSFSACPLQLAAEKHPAFLKMFLALPDEKYQQQVVSEKTPSRLHLAAWGGLISEMDSELKKAGGSQGENPASNPDEHDNTPLFYAIRAGHTEAAKWLVEQAGVNPNAPVTQAPEKLTALAVAKLTNNSALCEFFETRSDNNSNNQTLINLCPCTHELGARLEHHEGNIANHEYLKMAPGGIIGPKNLSGFKSQAIMSPFQRHNTQVVLALRNYINMREKFGAYTYRRFYFFGERFNASMFLGQSCKKFFNVFDRQTKIDAATKILASLLPENTALQEKAASIEWTKELSKASQQGELGRIVKKYRGAVKNILGDLDRSVRTNGRGNNAPGR